VDRRLLRPHRQLARRRRLRQRQRSRRQSSLSQRGPCITLAKTLHLHHGFIGSIYYDSDVETPFAADDAVRIVVLHRRYIDPARGLCGRTADEVTDWESENAREWFTIPLFLYDHSGTVYRVGRTNPFSCPWDSGRVGIIALKRSEWGNGAESDGRLFEYAVGIADEYTSWANGDCYGYVLQDSSGNELDSCWGFIGIESVEQELKAATAYHSAACPSAHAGDNV
jgi:hypothetical protein